MSHSDFLAWLCCVDDGTAFQIWKAAFLRRRPDLSEKPDHILVNHYGLDQQIRDYWKSPVGQLNAIILLFWINLLDRNTWEMRLYRLNLRWRYRHVR